MSDYYQVKSHAQSPAQTGHNYKANQTKTLHGHFLVEFYTPHKSSHKTNVSGLIISQILLQCYISVDLRTLQTQEKDNESGSTVSVKERELDGKL